MTPCSRLTFTELNVQLATYYSEHGPFERSTDRHGAWMEDRDSGRLGRIAYEIIGGPILVLWHDEPDERLPATPWLGRLREIEEERSHQWGFCSPAGIEIRENMEPEPWYGTHDGSGWSVETLFAECALSTAGVVRWGIPVPLDAPGVYAVALSNDPSRTNAILPLAPIDDGALNRLLGACDDLRVDGRRATIDDLRDRIDSLWLGDQTILYIGKAGTSVQKRVGQYYRTPLGARSPHAGGWLLKTLAILDRLSVHFAATDNPEKVERCLIETFVASIPPETHATLRDPNLPLPFANLQIPGNGTKNHGIAGATSGH